MHACMRISMYRASLPSETTIARELGLARVSAQSFLLRNRDDRRGSLLRSGPSRDPGRNQVPDRGRYARSVKFVCVLSVQEDGLLRRLIAEHGVKSWSIVSSFVPGRTGKSCRLR